MKVSKYKKDLRLVIPNSQDQKLESLKLNAKEEMNLKLSKTFLIRLAIFEFLEETESIDDLKDILIKYQHI